MRSRSLRPTLTALIVLAACRRFTPPLPDPSPEPAPSVRAGHAMAMDSGTKPDSARRGYTAADVRFVQHMIAHHAQALVMTDLLASRTSRDDMRLLAERIAVSQRTEIATMQRWLRERGEAVPDASSHAMPMLMPGMLTPDEMARLAAASGAAFDRLFLESMIRHHEGAIRMVGDLLGAPGSGQEPQLFDMANGIEADQRAEIDRMSRMLRGM